MLKFRYILLLLMCCVQLQYLHSQQEGDIKWWNPVQHSSHVIEGQAWPDKVNQTYDRLPGYAKEKVRKPVWRLSKQSAGLSIRFRTNSNSIMVRYKVEDALSMPHMPSTGVSGLDLYSKNSNGQWLWYKGAFSFGKTINYNFINLPNDSKVNNQDVEFQLYLPLYNKVAWLEIGVPVNNMFEPMPLNKIKPIVVYGTSIAQGACASRPGMAWTSVLQRKTDIPVINLGFSGNGKLEKEVIDLIAEIDGQIYILDCLPNLIPNQNLSLDEVYKRIIISVKELKQKRPDAPILLTEHAGYADSATDFNRSNMVLQLNTVLQKAFVDMKSAGINEIYLLSKDKIGFGIDSFVDGTHPSDYGMLQYALAYEKCIRNIITKTKNKK
ncbi:MAG: hypothetical protein DRJ10_03280 [Bacteroidetes bacterium]|nr:MAG: hypothetical protein DRJ10_03280 [Bacteroidota bacterium]